MHRTTKGAAKTAYKSEAIPFDLSTVKTKSQEPESRKSSRLFDIEEAPTFYPTRDEFKDSLAYIESIRYEGEKYGIIKIVPPTDYNPEFSLNTESFRFKTRVQKLNEIEGNTRTSVNYLEQIKRYYRLTGKFNTKVPQLEETSIDLYRLKKEVAARGGFQSVTRLKKWAEIGKELGYVRKQWTSLSTVLKNAYQKVILPYETWYGKHKRDTGQVTSKKCMLLFHYYINPYAHFILLYDSSSSTDSDEDDICEICNKEENKDSLLSCDNRAFHPYCLSMSHSSVPKRDQSCFKLVAAVGRDYGFEGGKEYNLNDFQTVCDGFKTKCFKKTHPEGNSTITEDECEREYWRLVSNPNETCQVEHGTQHGSGFSTVDHTSKSMFDSWNLNAIPVTSQSLFTEIKSDISGMMLPRLDVGMCFSTSGWHNEDHYTNSISYMHWGETKTWYGVPGSNAAELEDAMRKTVPELFRQQPDLLYQQATMLSPERLKQRNVKVYAVDQRPGQYVVTYPKAYHSSFNHGFNLCEAVNFATGNWVHYGLQCVESYKRDRRQPCFSHDNLLVTALRNRNLPEDGWLSSSLMQMWSREMEERKRVRSEKLKERIVAKANVRERLQCVFCNCYTYLSYIGCNCTSKVACLDHVAELCTCDMKSKMMLVQFTDDQLFELAKSAMLVSLSSESWVQRLEHMLESKTDLDMKKLRIHIKRAPLHKVPNMFVDYLEEFPKANTNENSIRTMSRFDRKKQRK
ncbi:hypothetical protein HMPREF1544_11142 [Mucor circinelloides 1006PhL]|uniref:[histone H3]-trimethyl-L-lysine(4) demethylase n=1 Tax=Mucor circinelloides f. circinelloides (strain 1006PhL) TaxID=1220926 RepID=S2IWN0_MUCC1|nr:hypothetical protein HMPREF1544_11142 [Mucor circinelloides 1006PhL]